MLILYRFLINIIFILSPIIILIRLLKKKEDVKRFKEKFCFFSKKNTKGKLIWFHGASVGELQSIVPILEKLEKNQKIKKILITSNTLSSSKVIQELKLKKIIHQFFPIDTNRFSKKFLNYWRPKAVFFIDSEIWPNMITNLNKRNIPIVMLNGRITSKTFNRWKVLSNFSKEIFNKFNLCLSSSIKSKNYLIKLGAKNVKLIGNLKFAQSENKKNLINNNLKKFFNSKKIWCASSTHDGEEEICGKTHIKLKKKYKNLITIIIPRHIERVSSIQNQLNKLNLKSHLHQPIKKIASDTDIYIVNTYGMTKSFYNISNVVFLGGSLINHGGQNPLEASRYGCKVLHGPNIKNFSEIYDFLSHNKISTEVNNKNISKILENSFLSKTDSKEVKKKLNVMGKKILKDTYKIISLLF